MKEGIHPEFYPDAKISCSCGNSWIAGSTQPEVHTDVCSKCHPFFTGEQRIVDAAGRVDRFMRKLEWRDQVIAEQERRKAEATSPSVPISDLGLSSRVLGVLSGAGLDTVGDVIGKLEEGDQELTNLKGFGLKSLADLKKTLRGRGFVLPGDEASETEASGAEVVEGEAPEAGAPVEAAAVAG
jgi:large subunit ribosomal protein L31